jgi:hypothetical protein
MRREKEGGSGRKREEGKGEMGKEETGGGTKRCLPPDESTIRTQVLGNCNRLLPGSCNSTENTSTPPSALTYAHSYVEECCRSGWRRFSVVHADPWENILAFLAVCMWLKPEGYGEG